MACAYLLSLDDRPAPPKLEGSYSTKHWAKMRADSMMEIAPQEADGDLINPPLTPPVNQEVLDSEDSLSPAVKASASAATSTQSFLELLKDVLDLHTSRRMKVPLAPGKIVKQGISIPSQRRYLYYWALLLAQNNASTQYWDMSYFPGKLDTPKVQLTQIVLRMREAPIKANVARAVSLVMNIGKNVRSEKGHVWASLARYDDKLVELLETWEKQTRDEKHGSEQIGDDRLDQPFEDGRWDKGKMIRSFARLGVVSDAAIVKSEVGEDSQ